MGSHLAFACMAYGSRKHAIHGYLLFTLVQQNQKVEDRLEVLVCMVIKHTGEASRISHRMQLKLITGKVCIIIFLLVIC